MRTVSRDLDINEAAAPDEIAPILRMHADKFRIAQYELQSAWQDKQAGRGWLILAREFDKLADRLDRIDLT